jgi:hypothetical protein
MPIEPIQAVEPIEPIEPANDIQAAAWAAVQEYRAAIRWHPPGSSLGSSLASRGDPEQHILAVLTEDERTLWNRIQPPERAKLTREFRDDPITPNGLGYLRKKIVLLAPPAPDQGEAQAAAVGSAAAGKGA